MKEVAIFSLLTRLLQVMVQRASWLMVCILLCLSSATVSQAAQDEPLVVVVNQASGVDTLTKKEVVDIFMGRYNRFPNGQVAYPVDLPQGSSGKSHFYMQLVNQSERKIQSYWSRLLFSGRAKPPEASESLPDVVNYVVSNEEAIAYLPRTLITSEMKIVFQFSS
ncbi:hypothetical protein [Alteromonas antoniana]|uniref:hypothetical protein n=1 Tax=Alteromonas antoniana TaxID=2803813 RepID=UPI001C482C52|nr:hypothetical protein [Alteromonas antoniana]